MSIFGFKHGLETKVEAMAVKHGVEYVRKGWKTGLFEPQTAAVGLWLLWQDFKRLMPKLGAFIVGAVTVAAAVKSFMAG